jgi:hypothetical protein
MYGRGRGRGKKAAQQVVVVQPVLVEDVWVQCDNPDCKKWRKLPAGSKPPPDDVEWWAPAPGAPGSGARGRGTPRGAACAARGRNGGVAGAREGRRAARGAAAQWARARCAAAPPRGRAPPPPRPARPPHRAQRPRPRADPAPAPQVLLHEPRPAEEQLQRA